MDQASNHVFLTFPCCPCAPQYVAVKLEAWPDEASRGRQEGWQVLGHLQLDLARYAARPDQLEALEEDLPLSWPHLAMQVSLTLTVCTRTSAWHAGHGRCAAIALIVWIAQASSAVSGQGVVCRCTQLHHLHWHHGCQECHTP